MRRREFLKSTSAAALAAGSLAGPAAGAEGTARARTLRLATPWPDDVSGPGDHVRRLAATINAAAAGRWLVEVATSATAFADVMRGDADLYIAAEAAHVAHDRAFAWFAGLPAGIGLDADAHADWIANGGGQDLWDDVAGRFNVKALLAGWSGAAPALWSRVALLAPADLAGRRIAVDGLAREVAAGLGALPVAVAADEIADALAAGEIDMAMAPDASLATRARLAAVAPHGYRTKLDLTGGAIGLGMRLSFWNGLAAGDRVLLAALAGQAFAASRSEAAAEAALAASLPAGLLAPIGRIAAAIDDAIERVAASVVAEAAGAAEITRRIDCSMRATRARAGRSDAIALSRPGDLVRAEG